MKKIAEVVRGLILAVLVAVFVAAPAWAEFPSGTFTIQAENDRIANTDRHYTHGTRLTWVSDKASDGPQWAKDTLEWLYPLADLRAGRVGLILGHSIFTPRGYGDRGSGAGRPALCRRALRRHLGPRGDPATGQRGLVR